MSSGIFQGFSQALSQLVAEHMAQAEAGRPGDSGGGAGVDNVDHFPAAMKEWMAKHGQARALLEIAPPPMPDFLQAPPSQCQNQAEGAAVTHSQESHDPSSILQLWQPDWLPRLFDDVGTVTVVQDICERPATLAEETSAFRRKVDRSFGWHGKVLNDQQKSQRAAAQTTLQSLASTIVHSDLHVTVPTVLKLPCCQDQIHG